MSVYKRNTPLVPGSAELFGSEPLGLEPFGSEPLGLKPFGSELTAEELVAEKAHSRSPK